MRLVRGRGVKGGNRDQIIIKPARPLSEACIEKIAKPPEELHRESAIITAK